MAFFFCFKSSVSSTRSKYQKLGTAFLYIPFFPALCLAQQNLSFKCGKNLYQIFCFLRLRFFPPHRSTQSWQKNINILAICSWLVLPYLLLWYFQMSPRTGREKPPWVFLLLTKHNDKNVKKSNCDTFVVEPKENYITVIFLRLTIACLFITYAAAYRGRSTEKFRKGEPGHLPAI